MQSRILRRAAKMYVVYLCTIIYRMESEIDFITIGQKKLQQLYKKKNKQHFVYVSVSAEYKVIEEFQAQTTTTIGMTAIHHICVAYEVHIRGQRITNEKRKKNHGSKCEQQLFDFK